MTEQALKLAGIHDATDLPIPQVSKAMREKLFEQIKKELGPLIIETVMSSLDIDKTVLSVLELVNKGIEEPKEGVDLPHDLAHDEKQKQLNKACGDLFLNMVKLIPDTTARTFLVSERIRNLPAASLGKILRDQLMKTNLLKLINKGILAGLPMLSDQIYVNEEGELVIPDDLHFEFPETEEARAQEKAALDKEKIIIRKKLVKELTKTIRDQIVFRIKDFFTTNWKKIQDILDAWIFEKFGNKGLNIKLYLDRIFRYIFINVIGTAFQIIAYPFIRLLGVIINMHLKRKSEQISNTIHMDIHKNLIFKLAEEALKTINEAPAKSPQAKAGETRPQSPGSKSLMD